MVLLSGVVAFGQIVFENDTITKSGGAGEFEIIVYNKITNNSSDTAFRWLRMKNTFSNPTWTSAFCDNNLCYGVETDSADFNLAVGESFDLSAHFYPDGKEGCGSALIAVYPVNDPSAKAVARFQAESTNSNSCLSTLEVRRVNQADLTIAPNPARDFIRIELPGEPNIQVEVYDLLGKKVLTVNRHTQNSSIDISNLVKGIYIIKATTASGQKVAKTFRKVN